MGEDKKAQLAELEEELKDLKQRNPSHCSGKSTYVGHQMSPQLYEKIEELEDKIKQIKEDIAREA